MNQQIQDRVIKIIAKCQKIPPEEIKLEQPVAELCEDSLDLISLVFALEDEFQLDISDKAHEAKTVGDIILGIEMLLSTEPVTETSAV